MKNWLSKNIVGALAFGLALLTQIQNCNQQASLSDLRYRLQAIETQPRLKLLGAPYVKDVKIETDPMLFRRQDSLHARDTKSIPTVLLNSHLTVTSKLRLTNVGSALAKGFAYVQTDSQSALPMIREMLQHLSDTTKGMVVQNVERLTELLPGDTTEITFEHEVSFVTLNEFTIHYLVLYENELGSLYDTYVWSDFTVNDLLFDAAFKSGINTDTLFVSHAKLFAGDIVKVKGPPNSSYYTYSQEERDRIERFFKNYRH